MLLVSKYFREISNTIEAGHGAFVDLLGENGLTTERDELQFIVYMTLLLLRDAAAVAKVKLSPQEFVDMLMQGQALSFAAMAAKAHDFFTVNRPRKHAESLARKMGEAAGDES